MAERWGVTLIGADDQLRGAVAELAPDLAVVTAGQEPPELRGVVGIAVVPWPGQGGAHADLRESFDPPYWAVESWHRHPAFLTALQGAVAAARVRLPEPDAAHVLVTAPDRAARDGAPEDRVFLREVTEALAQQEPAGRCTLAWDHSPDEDPVTPTAVTVLRTLAEAHGRTAVVLAGVDPSRRHDPAVAAVAADLDLELVEVALDDAALASVLAAVADTVRLHEGGA